MNMYLLLAEAFAYPQPGQLERLEAGLQEIGKSQGRKELAIFVRKIGRLSLSEWEELATRTLDLSPAAAPYIGFHIWGENYLRGEFMARLNGALLATGVDTEGELPDHLAPVLVYLGVADQPLPELIEHFEPAVRRMAAVLQEKDKHNPYVNLFKAALRLAPQMKPAERA